MSNKRLVCSTPPMRCQTVGRMGVLDTEHGFGTKHPSGLRNCRREPRTRERLRNRSEGRLQGDEWVAAWWPVRAATGTPVPFSSSAPDLLMRGLIDGAESRFDGTDDGETCTAHMEELNRDETRVECRRMSPSTPGVRRHDG